MGNDPKVTGTGVPLTPFIILAIWIIMAVVYNTIGLPRTISLPLVLVTVFWFIIWLVRAIRRG